ncbi:MAG TPA: hypothetical protein VKF15_08285 [Nitrososphaerales archaeon]|nr:hypothetical protein [Nitrososphaerales archaeon]
MSEIRTFFRHCPACGRRFEIKLVSKKAMDEWKTEEEGQKQVVMARSMSESQGSPSAAVLEQGPAIHVDVESFEYTYVCKHCGHRWSEEREQRFEEKPGTPTD